MRQKAGTPKPSAEKVIKDIRRVTRKQYGAEEKIRIVLDGLRGEDSIAALCRRSRRVAPARCRIIVRRSSSNVGAILTMPAVCSGSMRQDGKRGTRPCRRKHKVPVPLVLSNAASRRRRGGIG